MDEGAPGNVAPWAADTGGAIAGGADGLEQGLVNTMLCLKEKAEELVRDQFTLYREQEELQDNTEWLFSKIELDKVAEYPLVDGRQTITRLEEELWAALGAATETL